MSEDVTMAGGCMCGAVRYRVPGPMLWAAYCHCTDCQSNSGTAYGVIVGVVDEQFDLLTGELSICEKIAESGSRRDLAFCGKCGTRIYARPTEGGAGFIGLRVGTVDQRDKLVPKVQIWCRSAQEWALVADVPQVETQPSLD